MKKMTMTTLLLSLTLMQFGCSSDSENTSGHNDNLVINFDQCTLGENEIGFQRLMSGSFDSYLSNDFKEAMQQSIDQISYALNMKPTKKWDRGASWNNKDDETGIYLGRGTSSVNGKYLILHIYAGQVQSIPNVKGKSTPNEINAIFANDIKGKESMNHGDLVDYEISLCGKYPATISVPTSKGIQNDPVQSARRFPLDINIPLNLSNVRGNSLETTARSSNSQYVGTCESIHPHDYNNNVSNKGYTASCSDNNYGTITEENGMVCGSGNGKDAKCSYDWSTSLACSYICR